jgi:hypothetical protein
VTSFSPASPSLLRAVVIGAGGGLASAGLFYSAVRGSIGLSLILLLLTPLPSLIAGFGWGLAAAVAAGVMATAIMAEVVAPLFAVGYALALAVPVAGVTHLLFLARYEADGRLADWYPVGRIVVGLTLYAAALPVLIAALGGGGFASLEPDLTRFFKGLAERAPIGSGWRQMDDTQLAFLVRMGIEMMPAAIASYWLVFMAANIYLAARVARLSGLLARPWPNLHWMSYPRPSVLVFLAALAGIWIGGSLRFIGIGALGAFIVAYLLQGLSVVHAIARGRAPWLLYATYATLALAGYVAVPLTALAGLLESLVRFRARVVPMPAVLPPGTV